MDFLLECIGFPPDHSLEDVVARVRARGEPAPWRGPTGIHLRYPLAEGLEVRVDREDDQDYWSVWPSYRVDHRLRVALLETRQVPDSPYDAFLIGVANPRLPRRAGVGCGGEAPGLTPDPAEEEFLLATYLTDARRLPADLPRGHVLAVSIAGFALDVSYVGENDGLRDPAILEQPCGADFRALGEREDPGGCMDVSLRIRRVRHIENPLTGIEVEVLEVDAPGRPIELFVSRWQLESEGMPPPRPGWRIEGVFLFTGRLAGGLPRRQPRRRGAFG